MIKLHSNLILTRDLPEEGLFRGDVGVVVDVHNGGAGYEVEFMTLTGSAVDACTPEASDVSAVGPKMIPHVREVAV